MPVSIPATITVGDEGLAVLASALGLDPGLAPKGGAAPFVLHLGERVLAIEFPSSWRNMGPRSDEFYTWPQGDEHYDPFTVFEGTTSKGSIRLAVGRCQRAPAWGKERTYLITFHITTGGKRPLCEFLETDDYAKTREVIATIRGTGASKRGMYGPGDMLPSAYQKLNTGIYRDYIKVERSWNKQAVIAHEDDIDTMLAHSLIQADLRFDIHPS
jgi:hypothetical protein